MSGRDMDRENANFVASLVAAGKRDHAEDGAELRAFERVNSALGAAMDATSDATRDAAATASNAVEAADQSRWSRRSPSVRPAKSWSARSFGFAFAACGTLFALSLVGGGLFIKKQSDEKEAASVAAAAQLAETQKQLDTLNTQLNAQIGAIAVAQAALANAKDEGSKNAAAAQLAMAQSAVQKTKASFSSVTSSGKSGDKSFQGSRPPPQAAPCTCSKLDPLCGCIQ